MFFYASGDVGAARQGIRRLADTVSKQRERLEPDRGRDRERPECHRVPESYDRHD